MLMPTLKEYLGGETMEKGEWKIMTRLEYDATAKRCAFLVYFVGSSELRA